MENHHSPDTEVFGVRAEAKQGGVTRKGAGETADLSSTSIRAELAKHGSTSATVDDLVKRRLLGKEVGEVLKRYFKTSSAPSAPGEPIRHGDDRSLDKGYPSDAYAEAQYRQIRAIYDERRIIVYQAYNDAIADAAVKGNSFKAPMEAGLWKPTRMTWVKPSAVWMAYRCGWTTMKDKNQARVLALHLSRGLEAK